jgi:Leucine-rich repeat (LRR) protein
LHLLDAEKNRDSHDSSSQAPSVSHNELWVSQMTVPGHQSERLRAKPEVLTKLQDTPVEKLDLVDVAEVNETDVKP